MEPVKIILSNKFKRSISTRAAIENLFKDLRAEEIIIDFSDIHFISSSAAHQIVTEVRVLEKKNIIVCLENMTIDINRMLELAKTDRKNIFTMTKMKHSVVRDERDLSKLLLDI